jgi:hypothetical protein
MTGRTTLAVAFGAALYLFCAPAAWSADLVAVQWHPGMAATELQRAKVVRVAPGFRSTDLASLRDDQILETPSGKQVLVSKLRAIQNAFAQAKARTAAPGRVALKILPVPTKPCTPPKPGETTSQVLARPTSDVVCLPSGRSISVEQLRALQPFVQHYAGGALASQRALSGPVVKIANRDQLMVQLQHAPDSTVLENSDGTRATVGELKAYLAARKR